MTLQTNAHPRLQKIFENGAKRDDIHALIVLAFEENDCQPMTVGHVCEVAIRIDYIDADYKQIARVLSQLADMGILGRTTAYGRYYYFIPPEPGEDRQAN